MLNKITESASQKGKLIWALGLGSLLSIPIFAVIGLLVADFGIMLPFIGIVFPSALLAIILGIVFNKKPQENLKSKYLASAGLLMGIISITLIVLLILAIMIIFMPGFLIN